MARIVNIHEAKTQLSRLIQEVLAGEEVIIARGNVPLVRLELLDNAKPTRRLGFAECSIKLADDFDALLEDFEAYQ